VTFEPIQIAWTILGLFIVFNVGLVLTGTVRKLGARVGRRRGIRIYQPYIDLVKNYALRSNISHGIMFYLAPVFRLSGGVGIFVFMPIIYGSAHFSNFSFAGDAILIMYFIFFGTLGMALGAGEAGVPFSAIGISRGLSQVTAAEIPLILAFLSVFIQYDSFSLTEIVAAQQGGFLNWTLFTNPIATAAGLLAFLGAMMRSPFDIVLAPQEIPIGPPTEFHSSFLGVLQTNRAIFPVAKTILYLNLFFGGATSWPILILKAFLLYMWSVVVGTVFPRFRTEQSIRWFMKYPLILGIISILVLQLG